VLLWYPIICRLIASPLGNKLGALQWILSQLFTSLQKDVLSVASVPWRQIEALQPIATQLAGMQSDALIAFKPLLIVEGSGKREVREASCCAKLYC
jgi:hypothetical protein